MDAIEQLIYENAALEGLHYFGDILLEEFRSTLSTDLAENSCTFINLIFKVPYSITPYTANLAETVGRNCVELTRNMIAEVTGALGAQLDKVGKAHIGWDSQLRPINAAAAIPPQAAANAKQAPPPHTPPVVAQESNSKNRADLAAVSTSTTVIAHLCYGLRNFEQVTVYDCEFNAVAVCLLLFSLCGCLAD